MQLTKSQNKAVKQLIDAFDNRREYKFSSFKAPTGAGKTFMASEFMSRVFAKELGNDKKTIFVVATISNAQLPKQFAKKLNDYKIYHEFNDHKIEYIESPSSSRSNKSEDLKDFYLEDNKIFVFGTSSFGKNTLFYQNKTLSTFLEQAKQQDYQIFFIRDEAHIGQKEKIGKDELDSFDEQIKDASDFIIYMTATPNDRRNLVEMTVKDMADDGVYLLKTNMQKTELNDEVTNEEIIDDAIDTFLKTKKEYQSLKSTIINPAMLIQVMNEKDYDKDPVKNQQFHEGLELLERKLQNKGLKYLKYLNNAPEVLGTTVPNTLSYASRSDSEIDAIIFKVGPATGWDIPRANMLLQLRNVSSEALNMQTVGRIMRNPFPDLKKNPITNKYYIWSNYQKPTRDTAIYKLKEQFKSETFPSGRIDRDNAKIAENNKKYVQDVLKFLDYSEFQNAIKDININDIIYEQINYGTSVVKNKIPNHIFLSIYIARTRNELEKDFKLSLFEQKLNEISKKENININIVWYVLLKFKDKLQEIHIENLKWIHDRDPYNLNKDSKTLEKYILWKDNDDSDEEAKSVKTDDFKNYGYFQITGDSNIQFLDSTPEKAFYDNFNVVTSTKQKQNIDFFAKMPTLGSQVYYEYCSKLQGKITKSYMDFAIKYKGKTIMVEAKSFEEDYNREKTDELLNAYKIYMEKFHKENISLVLYQYDKKHNNSFVHLYDKEKWISDISFRDFIDKIFD